MPWYNPHWLVDHARLSVRPAWEAAAGRRWSVTSIVFDTLHGTQVFRSLRIHPDFLFYDLVFIAIFLAVFVFEWVMAVRRQTYARWCFLPFLRWYDLVSCIPIGSLRLLRLLRVVSLLIRLHRMGIVDLTDSRVYRFFEFYFSVFIHDRPAPFYRASRSAALKQPA